MTLSATGAWNANAVIFRSYTPLAAATGYTVSTTPGGHQNAAATWTVNLIGGDFSGTITATPGGGVSQCEIYSPISVTFPHTAITSLSFQFTPLIVDSVTFTFTNSGSFWNPGPYTDVSTGEYFLDTFSGSSGTAIQSHTSSTLPSGLTGTAWGAVRWRHPARRRNVGRIALPGVCFSRARAINIQLGGDYTRAESWHALNRMV